MDLVTHLKRKIRKYSNDPSSTHHILIAISGGVDSVVLTDVMSKTVLGTSNTIGLAHVNYGIRSDANEAEAFCSQIANQSNCQFHNVNFEFTSKGESFEKWARDVRYQYLSEIAHEYNYQWILTAHHKDDQLETLFMRYSQKADWVTMQGIREQLGKIKRPFLDVDKSQLTKYAREHDLKWIDDPTNMDLVFLRNEIRHVALPKALRNEPGLPDYLFRLSANAKRRFDRLVKQINVANLIIEYKKLDHVEISKSEFLKMSDDKMKIVIKLLMTNYLGKASISLSGSHWASFWQFIRNASTGTVFELSKDVFSIMDRKSLYLAKNKKEVGDRKKIESTCTTNWYNNRFKVELLTGEHIPKSTDKKFAVITINEFDKGVFIRRWKSGDNVKINSGTHKVKISDLFINHKIPVFKKWYYPVVVNKNDEILWVPGLKHASLKEDVKANTKNNIKIECVWT